MTLDPIRPYLPLVYGGVIVIVVAGMLFQRHRIKTLEADVALRAAAVQGYASAQTTNLAAIDKLQAALARMVAARARDAEADAIAVKQSLDAERAAAAREAAAKQELANVYARVPSARAWGSVGVDRAVADRLPNRRADRPN